MRLLRTANPSSATALTLSLESLQNVEERMLKARVWSDASDLCCKRACSTPIDKVYQPTEEEC